MFKQIRSQIDELENEKFDGLISEMSTGDVILLCLVLHIMSYKYFKGASCNFLIRPWRSH